LEAGSFEGHPEHSSIHSIFSLFGYLCTPGTVDLLILSLVNHLEPLLLLDAIDFSGVVADRRREVHAKRFDGQLKVCYCMRTQAQDIMKQLTDEGYVVADGVRLLVREWNSGTFRGVSEWPSLIWSVLNM
jgi:hypothetical protein